MSRPQRILFYCPAIILVLFVCGMFTSRAATAHKDISPAVVAEDGRVAIPLTPDERSWLTGHRTVRVAFDGYFPPYSFLSDTGRYEGLAVDIFKILADRTGITFVPLDKPLWKDLFAAAKRREVDVVATMGHRPEREQWFVFTRPYIFKSMMIMTRKEIRDISGPDDLAGRRVALVQGYQYVRPLLAKYPTIIPVFVDSMLAALNDVAIGRADAALIFLGAGYYLKNKYQLANLRFAAVYESKKYTDSIGVRGDWPLLASILDKALASISEEQKNEINRRWLGPERVVGISHRTVFIFLAVAVGIVLFLVAGFLLWSRTLRRQVMRKTEELRRELAERRKVERILQENEERFRTIFNAVNDAIFIHDAETGVILDVNRKTCEMFKMPRQEILSADVVDLSSGKPPYTQEAARDWMRKAAAGELQIFEWQSKDATGRVFWTEVNMRLAVIVGSRRIIVSAREIGRYKQAQAQLLRANRFLRTINRCNEIIANAVREQQLLDDICRTLITSQGYRFSWIGYAEKNEGKTVRPMAQAGFEEGYLDTLEITWENRDRGKGPTGTAIRTGKPVLCRNIATDPKFAPWRDEALKRGYTASIALPLILDHHVFGALSIYVGDPGGFDDKEVEMLVNMTESLSFGIGSLRTRVDLDSVISELEQHRLHLEELVAERTRELEAANFRLKEIDRLKSLFIASMSHELRTPLNSIIGFSSILKEEWLGPVNAEQKENLAIILNSGKYLLALINDVIDITKVEAGMMESMPTSFVLQELVVEARKIAQVDIGNRSIAITEEIPALTMHTDRRRLLQCLVNLLSNAIKFTNQGKITIIGVVTGEKEQEQILEIQVHDTGIGITESDIATLFKPFVRLHPPGDATYPGTGLGLYLTDKIMREILAGEVLVNSVPGRGSIFTLRLPVTLPRTENEQRTKEDEHGKKSPGH